MTQEEKNKLYKYLCAVLPYGVVVQVNDWTILDTILKTGHIDRLLNDDIKIKPYLRPMESMTKEEFEEFNNLLETSFYLFTDIKLLSLAQLEWLNKNHFDYMRLIDDDLAIDKTKEK